MVEYIYLAREQYANSLSDNDISKEVVHNVIRMEAPLEMKADILLQSIKDLGKIYVHLRDNFRNRQLSSMEFKLLVQSLIKLIKKSQKEVEFNPLSIKK